MRKYVPWADLVSGCRVPSDSGSLKNHMTKLQKRRLERVRYWQGQMLRSADFRDQNADTAQHRWWHNRAIHNAYGVYQGLQASAISPSGTLTGISVAPGLAYDCFGRELILESTQIVSLPKNISQPPLTIVLLMSYTAGGCRPHANDEICWTSMAAESTGTAAFSWVLLSQVKVSDGVPLAQVEYDQNEVPQQLPFVPPGARPISRPAIATGTTLPETTIWAPWIIDLGFQVTGARFSNPIIGAQTRIDTSEAGFTRTPCYFAWLGGPVFDPNTAVLLPDMFTSVDQESASGFTFRLWIPPQPQEIVAQELINAPIASGSGISLITGPLLDFSTFASFARQQKLYIQWLACQMPTVLPYVPLRLRILNQWLLPLLLNKTIMRNLIK